MLANRDRVLISSLRALCAEREIAFEAFSGDWILRLSRGEQTEHIVGYTFPLNSAAAHAVATDKAAAAELLATRGTPCVEHRLFLRPGLASYVDARGNWGAMIAMAEAHNWNLVCKPNDGTGGGNVVRVQNPRELEAAVHSGFARHRALALSPFHRIAAEYRAVVLAGEVLLMYAKHRPEAIGDGTSTLGDLAAALDITEPLAPEAAREIVPAGERRLLDWRHNLGRGARAEPVPENVRDAVAALALRAAHILGLGFASIDVVSTDAATPEALLVMEANAGVMLETYARTASGGMAAARRIYGAALDQMFTPA